MRGGYTVFAKEATEGAAAAEAAAPKSRRFSPGVIFLGLSCAIGFAGVSWVGFAPTSFEAAVERGKVVIAAISGEPVRQPNEMEPAMVAAMQAEEFAKRLQEIESRPSGPHGIAPPTLRHSGKPLMKTFQTAGASKSRSKPEPLRITEAPGAR